MANDALIVPTFRVNVMPNEAASKAAGRPVFQEMEVVEIRFAANRQTVAVFPAHDPEPNATREKGEIVTYAMLYNEQYRQFKAMETQDVSGTPLSEATFLTESKRRELKALNIHTVDALAALDGQPLKQLGMGGREMKNQARAYLDAAAGSADVTAMAAEIAALRQQVAERDELVAAYASTPAKNKYQRAVERSVAEQAAADAEETKPLDEFTDPELRDYITGAGETIRANASRATLLEKAMEIATRPEDEAA